MDSTIKLRDDLQNLIHANTVSKQNVYSLIFVGFLIKKYDILMNCKFDNFLTFIQYIKEEISTKSYSQDELSLMNQSLNNLTVDFNLNNIGIKQVVDFINNYSKESYLEFIRIDLKNNLEKYNADMPEELSKLVSKILNTKKGGKLVDLICGNGNFLTTVADDNPTISVFGLTKSQNSLLNTEIRLYMLNCDYQVDFESEITIKESFSSYDSIFCLLPPDIKDKNIYYNNFTNTKNNSVLWKYIDNAISMLNAKGKAIFILNNAPLFRNTELEFRKYLIDNKLVETIIELPSNILYHTGINTTMLILSKNSNMVNMIDATNMTINLSKYQKTVDIDKIYNAYISKENKISDSIIKDKNYSFITSNYLNDTSKSMNHPVKLKDYIDVYRGYRRSKVNENNKETIKIIQVANLNTNFIDVNDLETINYDISMEKDLLKDKDIIFSRFANNFQCKMVHLKENEKVIASENIIILRVKDLNNLSPYYLEEYLNSDAGKETIFANQVKSTATLIQMSGLSDTYIDLISYSKQLEIEKLCISKYDEMKENKEKINSINSSIKDLLRNK